MPETFWNVLKRFVIENHLLASLITPLVNENFKFKNLKNSNCKENPKIALESCQG